MYLCFGSKYEAKNVFYSHRLHTKTYKNLEKSSKVVLQLLSASNLKVIRKLGKISGKLFDKDRYLNSYNLLQSWKDYNVLKDTCALIELEKNR